MKYEPIPITPSVVAWARARAGFSLDEALGQLKGISEWERGDAMPTYPQLEKMADLFKVPVAVFFFPAPPDLPEISESFRTLPVAEYDALPRRIRYLVRKAKVFQLNLAELEGPRNSNEKHVVKALGGRQGQAIDELASEVRSYLNVSLDEQQSWASTDEALANWRSILQSHGVSVFKDQFRSDDFSGFCIYDREYPIIYVNNTSSKNRQIFTLFHELAHLLFETSGIDTDDDSYIGRLPKSAAEIEVKCNEFAAEFLLPQSVFNSLVRNSEASEANATAIAERYHVSREFVFRRYLDRGLVSQSEYREAARKWADQKSGGKGGNYYNTKYVYLGADYVSLVLSNYHQNRIDEYEAADYLDTTPKNLSGIEARHLRGAA